MQDKSSEVANSYGCDNNKRYTPEQKALISEYANKFIHAKEDKVNALRLDLLYKCGTNRTHSAVRAQWHLAWDVKLAMPNLASVQYTDKGWDVDIEDTTNPMAKKEYHTTVENQEEMKEEMYRNRAFHEFLEEAFEEIEIEMNNQKGVDKILENQLAIWVMSAIISSAVMLLLYFLLN